MKPLRLRLAALTALLAFASCEKVINIDLNNSNPKLVVEGYVSDLAGIKHHVLLSKSVNFSADINSLPVSGALVIIDDVQSGTSDTLKENGAGDYLTNRTNGISGHTYKLSILTEGNWYYASSTMPKPVPFDSLYTETLSFFGNELKQFVPVFNDPPGEKNYYRFLVQINDSMLNDINAWDDRLSDGKTNSRPLNVGDDEIFRGGGRDTAIIQMRCIDKGAYDFYNTFYNAAGGAATPSNPTSNISNGALGVFSAHTVSQRSVHIP